MTVGNGSEASQEGSRNRGSNIVLMGVMGSGKSTVGERLAYYIGFGFIDVDRMIEKREKKPISEVFKNHGEDYFRQVETQTINDLRKAKNQVIAVGGGAVMHDESWAILKELGTVVWLNTPSIEIARRFVMKPDEIRSRPLVADLVEIENKADRQKKLNERIGALISQRHARYSQANLVLEVSYSTAETSAQMLKTLLTKEGFL